MAADRGHGTGMDKTALRRRIDTAAGRIPAELVIKNCRVVDVYNGCVTPGDIAITDGAIAGVGSYEGEVVVDAGGTFAAPGFIDSHIHIESSYVSPEELGRLLVPRGGTTIVTDPHEIANVCGERGIAYMMAAAENTALDIKFVLPSCVPATPFENAGAVMDPAAVARDIGDERFLGLGEFMDYPGVIQAREDVLKKLLSAWHTGKIVDGHSPALQGHDLTAYAAAGILTDHECATADELRERVARGMYVMLRQGSACHDLRPLLRGVTAANSRRCLFCSDDRQPGTIRESGHLDDHLRLAVREGLDPVTAIQMASLNAAECYRLLDRGAIAPGRRADIVLLDDVREFRVGRVFIRGVEVARDGRYLPEIRRYPTDSVTGTFQVRDFSLDRLKMALRSDRVHVIGINPGGVVTTKVTATVRRDGTGDFVYDPEQDIAKIAVVERHRGTGNVAVALLGGYGIRHGAVALSIAHDSHNIIVVGVNNADMALAVEELIRQNGGVTLVRDGAVLERLPMPIAGIMSDRDGDWVESKLTRLHDLARSELGVGAAVEPIMTLCFMSLPVIPELKLTDLGLFDVGTFTFIPVEAD